MSADPEKLARAREHRKRWEESRSICPCSRPKVTMKDGWPICAHCLELETRKVKKHLRPNEFAQDSGDNYPLHLDISQLL